VDDTRLVPSWDEIGCIAPPARRLQLRANGRPGMPKPQLVERRVEDLRAHPSYERCNFGVCTSQLSALDKLGDLFAYPLMTTRDETVIDGYGRWKLAVLRGIPRVLCLEYDVDNDQARHMMLACHRRLHGFNPFQRARHVTLAGLQSPKVAS
jgi:hypothetical protein